MSATHPPAGPASSWAGGPTTAAAETSGRPSWADLEAADPELAATARALLERTGTGEGMLASVRGDLPPRIHPVNVAVIEGRLLTVVLGGSAKARDLLEDGRYALHAHLDPSVPRELLVRGHAVEVTEPAARARLAAAWAFEVDDEAHLLELAVEHVLLGDRPDADAWPPAYRSVRPRPASRTALATETAASPTSEPAMAHDTSASGSTGSGIDSQLPS
jgi:hypothetical protein